MFLGRDQGDAHMVARKEGADGPSRSAAEQVFEAWRRLLSGVAAGLVALLVPAPQIRASRARSALSAAPFVLGLAALVVGASLRVLTAEPGGGRASAIIAAGVGVVWAFGRLLVIVAVLREHHSAAWRPWGLGLIPFVAAVSPELSLLAWMTSGAVTWWALAHSGVARPLARRAVGLSWGVQAAFTIVAWIAVNAWVVLLATR